MNGPRPGSRTLSPRVRTECKSNMLAADEQTGIGFAPMYLGLQSSARLLG